MPGVTDDGFCQCGCHHHEKKQEKDTLQVFVGGDEITLNARQRTAILALLKEAGDAE